MHTHIWSICFVYLITQYAIPIPSNQLPKSKELALDAHSHVFINNFDSSLPFSLHPDLYLFYLSEKLLDAHSIYSISNNSQDHTKLNSWITETSSAALLNSIS